MTMQLRPYQQKMVDDIYQAWESNHQNIMSVMPTGSGKSLVVSSIVNNHQGACVVIAHRSELVSQMSMHLARDGIRHRIIASMSVIKTCINMQMNEFGRTYYNEQSKVAVASVQTIVRRGKQLKRYLPTVTLWIIDESAHLQVKNIWGKTINMFNNPNVKGLGVTATPLRADGKGLGRGDDNDGVMDKLLIGPGMRDLINEGHLTDYRIFAPSSDIDVSQARISKSTGDYNINDVSDAVGKSSLVVHTKSQIVGDVVSHYLKIAPGKLGITFVPDMKTGEEITKQFNTMGVPAELINAKTPPDVRASILHRFANRQLMQLVNIEIFSEGFDCPAIEVVSMARPTKSFSMYCQQFGRSVRLMKGKTHAIIIDHCNNVQTLGLPDSPRSWSLERRTKRNDDDDTIHVKTCPECSSVYERYKKECPYCGHKPIPADRSDIKFVDGDLSELSPEVLAKMRGEVELVDTPIDDQLLEYRRQLQLKHTKPMYVTAHCNRMSAKLLHQRESQVILRDKMSWWAGHRRAEGKTDDELYKIFYLRYGVDWIGAQALPGDEADALTEGITLGKKY